MKVINKINWFASRYPLVGSVFWTASIQFFIVQLIVGQAWPISYSIAANTISDLGNSACGLYSGKYVCSSLHVWMNASFILLGLTMILGSVLIYHQFKKSRASALGFALLALAGIGSALVGLFPENTIASLHILGAGLTFVSGPLGLLVLGTTLDIPWAFRLYSIASAVIALVALLLFITHIYLGLGIGGMERLTAHPVTIWLIIFGFYKIRKVSAHKKRKAA